MSFYYDLKKNFQFEKYLDNVARCDRKAITKLRLSCHALPIEQMRYQKVDKAERKCSICSVEEVGDEWHYLSKCQNENISTTRLAFVDKITTINLQLKDFNPDDLMKYCMTMNDTLIQTESALFVKNMLNAYSEAKLEEEGTCSLM